MFKILAIVVGLTTHTPLAYGISDADYASEAECKDHIGQMLRTTAERYPHQGYQAMCITKEAADKLNRDMDEQFKKDDSI